MPKQSTPRANRPHIGIFGQANAGKSTLFNALLGAEVALVSPHAGTTTDPVMKNMELLPYGPVVWVDTAGLDDGTPLGTTRQQKTMEVLEKIDVALYIIDPKDFEPTLYETMKTAFEKRKVPHLVILSKTDASSDNNIAEKFGLNQEIILPVSIHKEETVATLKQRIIQMLEERKEEGEDQGLFHGLTHKVYTVLLIVPIDSEAPKGRLILPQAQLIRTCMDENILCLVANEKNMAETVQKYKGFIDLVITDSKIFKEVSPVIPLHMPLTSFSIMMARQKSGLKELINGIEAIDTLQDNDVVLIAENCHHNHSHEDIGRVKIPHMLRQKTGKNLTFEFLTGHDYLQGEALQKYALVVHCGGCMVTRKVMENRIRINKEADVPITNYGMVLAYASGILERSLAFFMEENQ